MLAIDDIKMANFTIDCTGDAVVGDEIEFTEAVFGGSFKRPQFLGDRTITARITKDSYGADRQQHTFSMVVTASTGYQALAEGKTIRRKGRNVYRNGTKRRLWQNEADRHMAQDEKHGRGDAARANRAWRKEGNFYD